MKTWWGLGSAALSLVLIVFLWLPALEGLPTTERLSAREAAPGIDVPRIGTVGDFPDPAHRHVVNVTADGRIVLEGKRITIDDLDAALRLFAAVPPAARGAVSAESVVLRIDGAVSWGAVQRLLRSCEAAKLWRVSFAVAHEDDGGEGAVAVHRFPYAADERSIGEGVSQSRVVIWARSGTSGPDALFAAMTVPARSPTSKRFAIFDVHEEVPFRDVLAFVDAALRAGLSGIEFAQPDPRPDDAVSAGGTSFESMVRKVAEIAMPYDVELWNETSFGSGDCTVSRSRLPDPAPRRPPVARVHGAASGVTEPIPRMRD